MTGRSDHATSHAIGRLLRPRTVAIVGASATPGALGASVLANLRRMGFSGSIHLINPKRDQIDGMPCLQSIDALPEGIDVAILAIPQSGVLEALRQLARRKVGAAIIFSAGFAEGGAEGLAQQREIARVAAESGMIVEGPNCLGLVNFVDGIPLSFVAMPPLRDTHGERIGIVSQSGAMAAVLGVMLINRELALSYSISTGNEAVTGVEDYLEFMLTDPHTRVVALVVEQFRQPARFLDAARRARQAGKTIVLLHPGQSDLARAAAATHTGAIAGDYQLMRTMVERAGVVVAETLEELSDIVEIVARCGPPAAGGTAVITESGAFKALTLDLCERIGLDLPPMSADSNPAVRDALPAFVPVSNPLDLTAQALVDPGLYGRTLAALRDDARVTAIVFAIIQTDETTAAAKFPFIIEAVTARRPDQPILFAGLDDGAVVPSHYIQALRRLGVPYFPSPERAYRALARLSARATQALVAVAPVAPAAVTLPAQGGVIAEHDSKRLLAELGITVPDGRCVTRLEDAQAAARDIGFPVVLKAQSADLSHKSDVGGVVLNLDDADALARGWERLHADIARHRPGLSLDGVLVERMGARGTELIVGARNDPEWGAVLLVGFGGVQAEILKDVRLLPHDLPREAIVSDILRLKSAALLRGFRGGPALDVAAVADVIVRLGRLLAGNPRIQEIDINPLVVHPHGAGAVALDALMVVQRPYEASHVNSHVAHLPNDGIHSS
ncbi:MAG: acetate--CoA ligase family protein [Janthinobacterium lividum]